MLFDFKEDYRREHVLSWLEWPATTNNGPLLVGQNNKSGKLREGREPSVCTCRWWWWIPILEWAILVRICTRQLMSSVGLVKTKLLSLSICFENLNRPSRRNVLIHPKDHTVASIPIPIVLVVSHHGYQPFQARCAMRVMMMRIVRHPTARTIKSL
jgi:hypothetical protein